MIDPEYILPEQVNAESSPLIVDTRLAGDYKTSHIAGAVSNCVFEMAFAEKLSDLAPDLKRLVVVYGSDDSSYEAPVAYEKLKRLGYENVRVLTGGIQGWDSDSLPTEGHKEPGLNSSVGDGEYDIDLKESRIEWSGRNLLSRHFGTISLKSGSVMIHNETLVGGKFVIDMHSMKCTDLAGEDSHDVLIQHLKSDDFFDVDQFPECIVSILAAEKITNAGLGRLNLNLDLNVRIKDVRSVVHAKATAGVAEDGRLAAQSTFSFDRTMWEVIYGSGKFFSNLGMHLVNDLIQLDLVIVTK